MCGLVALACGAAGLGSACADAAARARSAGEPGALEAMLEARDSAMRADQGRLRAAAGTYHDVLGLLERGGGPDPRTGYDSVGAVRITMSPTAPTRAVFPVRIDSMTTLDPGMVRWTVRPTAHGGEAVIAAVPGAVPAAVGATAPGPRVARVVVWLGDAAASRVSVHATIDATRGYVGIVDFR